jgi:hypothetical protein
MDWTHRLLSTITYQTKAGFSDGDFTWNTAATAKARVWQQYRVTTGAGGQELVTTHQVATQTDIPEGARVWIPGGDTTKVGESFSVLFRETADTLDGSYTLYILHLGR